MNPLIAEDLIAPNCGLLSLDCEIHRHLHFTLGLNTKSANMRYLYRALAIAVRDRLIASWNATEQRIATKANRKVHYLSLEFLVGRSLSNAVLNSDLEETTRTALNEFGATLEEIVERERDAGLGNGGLGRLAACFLDSCANLQLPVRGYGIRYEYGLFHQLIEQGRQVEEPDHWLLYGNPWELERSESTRRVRFYGRSELYYDAQGVHHCRWVDTADVLAVPFDMPIPGFRNKTVNTLRLWKAAATNAFDLNEFNAGGYSEAVAAKNMAEKISMVLYPNDSSENGKELRLKQQYFLVSASLQDVLSDWVERYGRDLSRFGEANCFQLNDTHPACAVPELMRLLMDEYGQSWDQAWKITTQCMAYTNHTLLPEALERWSVRLFSRLLPRLAEIIFEINRRFLQEVEARWPGNTQIRDAMAIVEGGDNPHFRMAYLAIVGSFSVNGVAQLHTELLKSGLFEKFHEMWPDRFNNKTNGVTQRRWLAHCNPKLRQLITSVIGGQWEKDLSQIEKLRPLANDPAFRQQWQQVKAANKTRLARYVEERTGVVFPEQALFDVQVKRIHEYKRQLLNVLHVIHLYDRICRDDTAGMVPRCVLIGGKAAPGYFVAKVIIKLINNVAAVINNDPRAHQWLKLVFLPNYQVSAMEVICPGTELSEQISTAGKEASGTGNMKFMMNGALTIGTLDGANIEIREKAGAENFFLFGLNAAEVVEARMSYDPSRLISQDNEIRQLMELLEGGRFSQHEPGIFDVLTGGLRNPQDPWLTIADLRSYIDAQREVAKAYQDSDNWNRMSIINTASSGWFSSDRTIQQYADEIWKVGPVGKKQ
ncbi:MAG TPA: glycogen phosphorylase [Planctomycetaceae bacterium]|nr:glycogen phosphorylase [Planctomycetaceae bacterium]